MRPTALVFGATGLTGRHVVARLLQVGVRAVAHVRPDSPLRAEWTARFERDGAVVSAAPWTADAIGAVVTSERPALVFGLLGTTRSRANEAARAGRDESYEAVDVRLTELAIAACRGVQPRFVYLSSVGTSERAAGAYLQARARVERTLRDSGVPYTIARPSFLVGERERPHLLEQLGAPLVDGLLAAAGALGATGLRERWRSITGVALAKALVALAQDPAWAGRVAEPPDLQQAARAG